MHGIAALFASYLGAGRDARGQNLEGNHFGCLLACVCGIRRVYKLELVM